MTGHQTFDAVETIPRLSATFTKAALRIDTDWPTRTRRGDININLRAWQHTENPPRLILSTTRLNLHSGTAKNGLAITLTRTGIDKPTAEDIVHRLTEHLLELYRNDGNTVTPTPRARTTSTHLIYPIWPATGGTLVAAGTNSFKSLIALAVALQAATGIEVLTGNTRAPINPIRILYLDWESDEASFAERLYGLSRGHGLDLTPSVAYRQLTQPLTDVVDTIRDEIKRHQYAGVIIDSLSAAVGGSLVDDELANLFWNAQAALETPALVLAHKSQEAIRRGHQRVFGSVMHENRSRMLWDAYREPDSALVRWEVVSDNNTGRKGQKLAWRIDVNNVGEDHARHLDSITITGVNPNDVRQAPNEGDTLVDRITYTLTEHGPLMAGEIGTVIGSSAGTVRSIISRHSHLFDKKPDSRYSLKPTE